MPAINTTSSPHHKKVGQHYEDLARRYLQQHGLHFICANFHSKFGEIDLIMQDKSCLVFVEVKYRRNHHYGHAVEMISPTKQTRLIKTAQVWLYRQHRSIHTTQFRFDLVAIEGQGAQIEWIENAITQG